MRIVRATFVRAIYCLLSCFVSSRVCSICTRDVQFHDYVVFDKKLPETREISRTFSLKLYLRVLRPFFFLSIFSTGEFEFLTVTLSGPCACHWTSWLNCNVSHVCMKCASYSLRCMIVTLKSFSLFSSLPPEVIFKRGIFLFPSPIADSVLWTNAACSNFVLQWRVQQVPSALLENLFQKIG